MVFFLLQAFIFTIANGANILVYCGLGGPSHVGSIWPLVLQLASNGHNITVLTTVKQFPVKLPRDSQYQINIIFSEEMHEDLRRVSGEDSDLIQLSSSTTPEAVW